MPSKGITIENISEKNKYRDNKIKEKLNDDDAINADELIKIMLYLNLSVAEISEVYKKCKHSKK